MGSQSIVCRELYSPVCYSVGRLSDMVYEGDTVHQMYHRHPRVLAGDGFLADAIHRSIVRRHDIVETKYQ